MTGGTLAAGAVGFQIADTTGRTGAKWGNVNVTGGGTFSSTGPINLSLPNLANTGVISAKSGGTVVADTITAGGATPTAILNFDGGTLRAQGSTPSLVTANVDRVTVYSGGLTVDTNGVNKSIDTVVAAPVDSGISGITLAATGTAYEGRPIVQITDPTGTGATAMADFDLATGQVTGVTITSPGSGYTSPTVTILGGGGSAVTGTATVGSVTSGGLTKTGAGTLTLNSANTYTGATTVIGGSLFVGGAGDINTSSSITVNGSGARFGSTSSVPVSRTVTVTSGGVDGTGTLNTVNVASNPANTIFNGNGGTGTLTIGTLDLAGAANFNLNVGGTSPVVATTTLNTNGTDNVLVNANNTLWTEGTYNLISYSTLGGSGFAAFEKGTISGLSGRQSATLSNPAGFIALTITGDNPRWSGAFSNEWSSATLPNPKNWQLITSGTPTDYIQGDIVLFDDTATTTNPTISVANVSPSVVLFDNSTKNYTLSGAFGIAGATGISKSGTGALTIANANTYAGGTTLNSGTLNINNGNALGTGALNIANGATIDNTSGSPVTLANNAQVWNGDVTFGGTNALNMGTGAITRPGSTTLTVNGSAPVTLAGDIPGLGAVTKAGPGTLVFTGNNTYTGATVVRAGELQVTAGTTGVLTSDINLAPETADVATMTVTGGTINVNRLVVAGASGNNTSPGTAVLNQSAGTINSQQWFTVGSGGSAAGNTGGSGTYNFSGGTHNIIGQQMEVANFTGATGTVNMSGSATLNVRNNLAIRMGANNNAGNGTFTQDGGNVTFYPDAAGTTPGGNGVLFIGGAGTLTSTHTYNLNGGTLTVPQIQRNTANAATANFNFNGGTLRAARTNPTFMFGLTRANVRNGGAIIDTNGFDATVAQPLLHSNIGGDAAIDGGLTKNGAGTLVLGGASTYTGATVVNGGTLRLPAFTQASAVGNYSFDELPDGGLPGGTVVANTGAGGATMNGAVNHTDNVIGDPGAVSAVPGRFGKGVSFDGLGSSIDVANRIVDQAGGGSWTLSAWIKTPQAGSSLLIKNAGGNTWQAGHSEFYLGTNPIAGNGNLPTAVRNAGGFVQGNQNVVDDAWHMITYVSDEGVKGIYVDGVPVVLNQAAFNNADTATLVRLGYHGNTVTADGGAFFAGTMDEVKFFTGALTAGQIQGLYDTNTFTPVNGKQYLPTATAVNLAATGATLDLGDNSQTIGSLAGVSGSSVALGSGTLITGGTNATTAFAGNIGGTGGVTKVGTGTQTLSGTHTYTGGTNVQAGTLQVRRMHENNPVNISGGKLQVLDSSPTLPSHPSGDNAFVSRPSALAIANNGAPLGSRTYAGQLDLGNNDLILDYDGTTPLADIQDMIRAGYNGGDWLGNGITSSTANANRNFAIGVADNANLAIPFDSTRLFSGQVVDTTTILVKFTHRIDLDLDGVITTNDATIFNSRYSEGAPAYWSIGDLDYDRVFTTNDATLFNSFYNEALASVPEPAAFGLLTIAGAAGLFRRRVRASR